MAPAQVALVVVLGLLGQVLVAKEPAPKAPRLRVQLQLHDDTVAGEPRGEIWLRPLSQPDDRLVVPVRGSRRVSVELPEAGDWEMAVVLKGYWAPRKVVGVPAASQQEVTLRLWPTGTLSGSLTLDGPREAMPRQLELRAQSPPATPGARAVPPMTAPCPVAIDGTWACELPSGVLDVALRAPPFIPHYRWGVRVRPGESSSLGALALRPGASLAGWLEAEDGAFSRRRARVRLAILAAPGSSGAATAERLQQTTREVGANERGFFQITGIRPGTYLLEALHEGFAPTRVFPLEIWPGRETRLKAPVVLRRPIRLELALTPPRDWLGRPWRVVVQRASDFSRGYEEMPAFSGEAGVDGRVSVPDQAPGTFLVSVEDSLGNGFLYEPSLTVASQEEAEHSLIIPLVDVVGTVHLGDEPVLGTLWFGGRYGALRSKTESNREGEFTAVLPEEGRWRVEVRAKEPDLVTNVRVEVAADAQGVAEVDIDLPDTLVFGRVVGADDQAMPGARVQVDSPAGGLTLEADGEGRFEARAVEAGRAQLSATTHPGGVSLASGDALVEVSEGQPVGPVVLKVQPHRVIEGHVVGPRGAVPGAVVRLFSADLSSGLTGVSRTDLDGHFSAEVPGGTSVAIAVVSAPGHALQAFSISASEEQVVLEVPAVGGTLEVLLSGGEGAGSPWEGAVVVVWQDGLPLSLSALFEWAAGYGERFSEEVPRLRIPQLAPGEYTVCVGPPAYVAGSEIESWKAGQAQCHSGYLPPEATLSLVFGQE